jgi:hypothetical protein
MIANFFILRSIHEIMNCKKLHDIPSKFHTSQMDLILVLLLSGARVFTAERNGRN